MKGTLLALLLCSATSTVFAQELHLAVDGVIEPERLREALAEELEGAVLLDAAGPPTLSVWSNGQTATLSFVGLDGVERQRAMDVSPEPDHRLTELVLVASNLVRDQTGELLQEVADTPPPAIAEALPPAPETELEPPREGPPPTSAQTHWVHLGITGRVGVAIYERPVIGFSCLTPGGAPCEVRHETAVAPAGSFGLSVMFTAVDGFAAGLRRITAGGGYSSIEGTLFNASAAPTVELEHFVDRHVQLFGQLGFPLQGRTQTAVREDVFQAAATLGGGVRFWVADWFSIDAELDVLLALSDAFQYAGHELHQFGAVSTFGLTAGFHIAP